MLSKNVKFNKRKQRVRRAIKIKSSYPRLSVFVSNNNIYAQIIDDQKHITLCSSSTKKLKIAKANINSATKVGEDIAKIAVKQKINNVVFDKGAYLYHGKVKALSEAARSSGLKF